MQSVQSLKFVSLILFFTVLAGGIPSVSAGGSGAGTGGFDGFGAFSEGATGYGGLIAGAPEVEPVATVAETGTSASQGSVNTSAVNVTNSTPGDNQTTTLATSGETASATPQYNSLSDIIKAKDWKALGEYNCKIKAENPQAYAESEDSSSNEAKWNARFNPPQTVYYSCCG
ncbi:MAG TPA: hypothetical protein VN372_13875 [Methanospirillum sp.]|nr:hypothetical protein [Methanospirillum sp.]